MQLILRILIAAGGALFTFMAADFLIQPEQAASGLDMAPTSLTGLGAIRGDMTAFFAITGLSMLYGAWKKHGDILLIPAFMLGVALLGRLITMAVNGSEAGGLIPMTVEGIFVIVSLIGSRLFAHDVADGD